MRLGVAELGMTLRCRLRAFLAARSRLERLAVRHIGARLFKRQHDFAIADEHFRRMRGRPVCLL